MDIHSLILQTISSTPLEALAHLRSLLYQNRTTTADDASAISPLFIRELIPILLKLMSHPHPTVRTQAMASLRDIHQTPAGLLNTVDATILKVVVKGLGDVSTVRKESRLLLDAIADSESAGRSPNEGFALFVKRMVDDDKESYGMRVGNEVERWLQNRRRKENRNDWDATENSSWSLSSSSLGTLTARSSISDTGTGDEMKSSTGRTPTDHVQPRVRAPSGTEKWLKKGSSSAHSSSTPFAVPTQAAKSQSEHHSMHMTPDSLTSLTLHLLHNPHQSGFGHLPGLMQALSARSTLADVARYQALELVALIAHRTGRELVLSALMGMRIGDDLFNSIERRLRDPRVVRLADEPDGSFRSQRGLMNGTDYHEDDQSMSRDPGVEDDVLEESEKQLRRSIDELSRAITAHSHSQYIQQTIPTNKAKSFCEQKPETPRPVTRRLPKSLLREVKPGKNPSPSTLPQLPHGRNMSLVSSVSNTSNESNKSLVSDASSFGLTEDRRDSGIGSSPATSAASERSDGVSRPARWGRLPSAFKLRGRRGSGDSQVGDKSPQVVTKSHAYSSVQNDTHGPSDVDGNVDMSVLATNARTHEENERRRSERREILDRSERRMRKISDTSVSSKKTVIIHDITRSTKDGRTEIKRRSVESLQEEPVSPRSSEAHTSKRLSNSSLLKSPLVHSPPSSPTKAKLPAQVVTPARKDSTSTRSSTSRASSPVKTSSPSKTPRQQSQSHQLQLSHALTLLQSSDWEAHLNGLQSLSSCPPELIVNFASLPTLLTALPGLITSLRSVLSKAALSFTSTLLPALEGVKIAEYHYVSLVEALIKRCSESSPLGQAASVCLEALTKILGPRGISMLLPHTSSKSPAVRLKISQALASLMPTLSTANLQKLVTSTVPETRRFWEAIVMFLGDGTKGTRENAKNVVRHLVDFAGLEVVGRCMDEKGRVVLRETLHGKLDKKGSRDSIHKVEKRGSRESLRRATVGVA
ncbi:hypothetical protein HDU85_006014 [Gaertneriomyces sp. JEL0708]|nr:hypothetical protein HDU85_006014 [Gaertneriomyces sp. JEL0708]